MCKETILRRNPQEENLPRFWNKMGFPLKFTQLPIHLFHDIDRSPWVLFHKGVLTSDDFYHCSLWEKYKVVTLKKLANIFISNSATNGPQELLHFLDWKKMGVPALPFPAEGTICSRSPVLAKTKCFWLSSTGPYYLLVLWAFQRYMTCLCRSWDRHIVKWVYTGVPPQEPFLMLSKPLSWGSCQRIWQSITPTKHFSLGYHWTE